MLGKSIPQALTYIEVVGSHKVVRCVAKWHQFRLFELCILQIVVKSITNLISQSYGGFKPAVTKQLKPFKDDPSAGGCLIGLRNKTRVMNCW